MLGPRQYIDESSLTPVLLTVNEKFVGWRLDKYLAKRLDGYSRTVVQKLLKTGKVTVNDKILKGSHPVELNDKVAVGLPEIRELELTPQDIRFEILYEDEFMIAVNKPAGLIIHPGSGRKDGTLANGLIYHFKKLSDFHDDKTRPGIVHRLDKDTTGVLLVAKDAKIHAGLSAQFAAHSLRKEYCTIAEGSFDLDSDLIDLPIGRDRHDHQKMAIRRDSEGKEARSTYEVIERFDSYTFVRMLIHTGRTHQIRVHLKAIGHPLIVDEWYGRRAELFLSDLTGRKKDEGEIPLMSRLSLHARRISFRHPGIDKDLTIEAPVPSDMQAVLDALQKHRPLRADSRRK